MNIRSAFELPGVREKRAWSSHLAWKEEEGRFDECSSKIPSKKKGLAVIYKDRKKCKV